MSDPLPVGVVGNSSGRSFAPLFVTNFFGVLNDNFLKTIGGFVAIGWLADQGMQSVLMGLTGGALVLPYILCSPLADRLTVLYSKCRIVQVAKWCELPIVLVAIVGFALHSIAGVVAAILLMGLQSSLYSPAKYALVRDVGGVDRISTGMGGMEGVSFLAVLAGTIAAAYVADLESTLPMAKAWCLLGFAVLGLAFSHAIRADEVRGRGFHAIGPIRYARRAFRMARTYGGLNSLIVTLSVFWFAAAMLQLGLLVYGRQVLGLNSTRTGLVLSLAAIGIAAGQVLAGVVDRRHPLIGSTLVTGWIGSAILFVLYFVRLDAVGFAVLTAALAFDMGFFKLPLDAEIQKVVKGPRLNTILSYFNQVSFLFMLAASGIYAAVSLAFGPRAFLMVLAVVLAVTPVWFVAHSRRAIVSVGGWVMFRRYRVVVDGFEVFSRSKGPFLVMPNHAAMVDPLLLFARLGDVCVSPLCDELYFANPVAAVFLRAFGAVKVPDLRRRRTAADVKVVRGLKDVVVDALSAGRGVLFYPSGHICTEPREDIGTRQLAHGVCSALPDGVTVVGVRTQGLWGSIWSRKGRTRTPDFGKTLMVSVVRWVACLITRRRRTVTMHFEDLTDRVRAWAGLPRLEFNKRLEEWYNEGTKTGEEAEVVR